MKTVRRHHCDDLHFLLDVIARIARTVMRRLYLHLPEKDFLGAFFGETRIPLHHLGMSRVRFKGNRKKD